MKEKQLAPYKFILPVIVICNIHFTGNAQTIPSNEVLEITELNAYLKKSILDEVQISDKASLARYFRAKFSERFFYDYQTFYERLPHYNGTYQNQASHNQRALDHMGKYNDSTQWELPFNYLNGDPVNAYALRHLARQHKMVDIAFYYFNENKDPELINYFENQMRSLNHALEAGKYEKIEDGNGVYEAFRSGYRVLNWLWIHNMFLNEEAYSDEAQLRTIATLLQHGQHLYERNDQFKFGNHQTRGVSALAMLAILLRDFEGTDQWLQRAMERLGEHLEKEINDDGFQFERSVHYHMSDINNYFYVYQLAKINKIKVASTWELRLRSLFSTLVKIAYPDKSAPVLQDDTEIPWAEKNDISGAMTLGYLLFQDPEFGYFATNKVDDRVYWFLTNDQLQILEDIDQKRPTYGSVAFPDTHYYIMRDGWERQDKVMVISAGLDPDKPDHQHGDMLGIQAYANGNVLLPNYQVRYSLEDLDLFKNSMVKNVALVDNELQGKQWTSNKGGSGFGKFRKLPKPEVIAWETNDYFDFFVGKHDGFENIGVKYTRQVINVKDDFWIVKDKFVSEESHAYKQVWQGHYTLENGPGLIRSTSQEASGHDILQLGSADTVYSAGTRGKEWSVISSVKQQDFEFLTIIYPYKRYNQRIDETKELKTVGDWKVAQSEWQIEGINEVSLSTNAKTCFFNVNELRKDDLTITSPDLIDLFIKSEDDQLIIYSFSSAAQQLNIKKGDKIKNHLLKPGDFVTLSLSKF